MTRFFLIAIVAVIGGCLSAERLNAQLDDPNALPGQVIVAGANPGYLKYNGGGPVFLCGPDKRHGGGGATSPRLARFGIADGRSGVAFFPSIAWKASGLSAAVHPPLPPAATACF